MTLDASAPGWRTGSDPSALTLATDDDSAPVSRIWHTGLVVRSSSLPAHRSVPLRLLGEGVPLAGLNGHVAGMAPDGVELHFDGLDTRRLDEVTRFLRTQLNHGRLLSPQGPAKTIEIITTQNEIVAKLTAFRRHRVPVRVRCVGGSHIGEILTVDTNRLRLDLPSWFVGQVVEAEASSRYHAHRFTTRIVEAHAGFVVAEIPARWEQTRARQERRIPAPPHLTVRFEHPDVAGLRVDARVVDVSHSGLGLISDALTTGVYPELVIPELVIEGLTAQPLRLRGVAKVREDRAGVLGIHVDSRRSDPAERRRWHRAVGDLASPSTRLGATWSEMSWDLFRRARYFEISGRTEAHFANVKRPFAEVYRKLDSHPEIGCQVVHTSARGLEGTISLLRLYSQSVFGYQIARRQDDAPGFPNKFDVLREMTLRAYEQTRVFEDVRWQIGYVPQEASWSRFVHCEFPKRFEQDGLAVVMPFHAFEMDCTMPIFAASRGLGIGEATDAEIEILLQHLGSTRHPSYCASLDFVPDRYRLEPLVPLWADAGMERIRHTLVARRRGQPLAYAVIELAQPGLQLFGLLDSIRLYAPDPQDRVCFGSLLEAARTWCLALGRRRMAVLLEGPRFEEAARLQDLGPAELSIMSVDILPNVLEFVWESMAPREQRA